MAVAIALLLDAFAVLYPGGEDPLLLDADTQQQLIALGITSPVTRETAGAIAAAQAACC
jgi:hypothetical protein